MMHMLRGCNKGMIMIDEGNWIVSPHFLFQAMHAADMGRDETTEMSTIQLRQKVITAQKSLEGR